MLWGKSHLSQEASGKGSPVSVMLLLTASMPRLNTILPSILEISGNVRNSCSACNGVIPPEEVESRGSVSEEFQYRACALFVALHVFFPTSPDALDIVEGSLRNREKG